MKKIIIQISLLHASSRDFLTGIFHHLETTGDWNLKILQKEENPLTVDRFRTLMSHDDLDGMIITEPCSSELNGILASTDLPIVLVGVRDEVLEHRSAPTALLKINGEDIGTLGAQYLCGLGKFNSFGFIPAGRGPDWSDEERKAAFCAELSKRAIRVSSYRTDHEPGSEEDQFELAAWLLSLPKPAALMSACDWRAAQVLAACEQANVRVPGHVALIGVDNDEFVCLHSSPPLSSIQPGHEELGTLAARTLDQMLKRNGRRHRGLLIVRTKTKQTVIERGSSKVIPPATLLVNKARRFIRDNALLGIGVREVINHVHVSRRLLEMRFKAMEGTTVREAIEDVRLSTLKRLLMTSRRPIAVIAGECGFHDANALAHLFRKRTGISMREFRANAPATRKTPKRQPT